MLLTAATLTVCLLTFLSWLSALISGQTFPSSWVLLPPTTREFGPIPSPWFLRTNQAWVRKIICVEEAPYLGHGHTPLADSPRPPSGQVLLIGSHPFLRRRPVKEVSVWQPCELPGPLPDQALVSPTGPACAHALVIFSTDPSNSILTHLFAYILPKPILHLCGLQLHIT